MTPEHTALLVGGGLLAGIVNTMAGAGSLLTVPLLDFVGLPGQLANGSNRVGVLAQSTSAALRFHRKGVPGAPDALPLVLPTVTGAALGAILISQLGNADFKRLFGVLMLALVVPTVWSGSLHAFRSPRRVGGRWRGVLFFGIGVFGGAVQAGVGLALLAGLSASGHDLVRANSVKVVLNAALVLTVLPIFLYHGFVAWPEALVLAAGYAAGGRLGANLSVRGGERLVRPVIGVMVVALALRMLGWM